MTKKLSYVLLFPVLGVAYIGLMILGGIGFPFEFVVLGRRVHELESLTVLGGKSLTNLIEVPIAFTIGLVGSIAMFAHSTRNVNVKGSDYVIVCYALALFMYFLTPILPE